MKKFLTVFIVFAMVFSLAACGEKTTTVEDGGASEAAAETGVPDAETVSLGSKISTEFVEITVEESGITNSLKQSIRTGNFTRTFGPEDSADTDFAYIKGKITNKSTSSISDGIFPMAKVGDYTLEEGDVTIYKSDGDTIWGDLSPLVEYNYMMYVEIPNTLVDGMESCDFNFAFDEKLENVMGKDFAERDYKYTIKIEPQAAEEPQSAE